MLKCAINGNYKMNFFPKSFFPRFHSVCFVVYALRIRMSKLKNHLFPINLTKDKKTETHINKTANRIAICAGDGETGVKTAR